MVRYSSTAVVVANGRGSQRGTWGVGRRSLLSSLREKHMFQLLRRSFTQNRLFPPTAVHMFDLLHSTTPRSHPYPPYDTLHVGSVG